MKIYFPKCDSGAGISIRAVIDALLRRHKAERAQIAPRRKNVQQITSGWDYRPRKGVRKYAAVDAAGAETFESLSSSTSAAEANNVPWFDFFDPDPAVEAADEKRPISTYY